MSAGSSRLKLEQASRMSAGTGSLLELRVHASSGRSYWAFLDATAANESSDELGAAERAFSARLYREARGIYRELARRQPELALVHRRLGAIEMANERAAAAVPHLETALRLQPGSHQAVLELAEAHRQQGRPEAAAAALQATLAALGERTGAAAEEARTAVTVSLGRALLASGEEEGRRRGEQLIAALLRRLPDDADVRCAHGEARLLWGYVEEALPLFLGLISARFADRGLRRLLAAALATPRGLETLATLLPPSRAAAPSLAYLACVARDHGHLGCCVALTAQAPPRSRTRTRTHIRTRTHPAPTLANALRARSAQAVAAEPDSAAHLLQLLHGLERRREHAAAVRALLRPSTNPNLDPDPNPNPDPNLDPDPNPNL